MFHYWLRLVGEMSVEDIHAWLVGHLPAARESPHTVGELVLPGILVRVTPPSDYPPSIEQAEQLLGAPATAEVSFLVRKWLDDDAQAVRSLIMQTCAGLTRHWDAEAALIYEADLMVARMAAGQPALVYDWFLAQARPDLLEQLAAAGFALQVTDEPPLLD